MLLSSDVNPEHDGYLVVKSAFIVVYICLSVWKVSIHPKHPFADPCISAWFAQVAIVLGEISHYISEG